MRDSPIPPTVCLLIRRRRAFGRLRRWFCFGCCWDWSVFCSADSASSLRHFCDKLFCPVQANLLLSYHLVRDKVDHVPVSPGHNRDVSRVQGHVSTLNHICGKGHQSREVQGEAHSAHHVP